jgi:tetratricopeptide (TPR) repeat protein
MAKENVRTRSKKKQASALFQANRLDEARPLYERICEIDPLDADAWFQLGIIDERQGSLQYAEGYFKRALDLQPARAEIYFHLGYIVETQGMHDAALAFYREGLNIQPDFAIAHSNMGLIFEAQGKLDQAIACYREALRLAPVAEAHNNLGNVLKRLGHYEEAVASYQSALRIRSDFFEVHHNLGNLLTELRRLDEALPHLQKAAAIRADAKTLFNLGSAYFHQSKLHEAAACYSQALRLDPSRADTYLNLGTTLGQLGNTTEALACYREALKIKPDSVEVLCNIGELLIADSRLDEALASFQQALQIDPSHIKSRVGEIKVFDRFGDFERAFARLQPLLSGDSVPALAALAYASLCRHIGRCDDAITMMEGVLAQEIEELSSYQHVSLHFELGRLLDAAGEYDRAFDHYRQANALKREVFSPEEYIRHVDDIIATYNHDFMAKAPRAANDSERPLFIIGMPRSGTTLVEQILASHPQVAGGGELDVMNDIVAALPSLLGTSTPYLQCINALTTEACDSMSQQYLDRLATISSDARYVTDKMPGNFKFLGLIALLFPKARIIHCSRDPLDTCLSCYFQHFLPGHPYAYDLEHLGSYYQQYQRLMQHWRTVLTLPMLEVRYEDLVADQERVSRELIAFCDLPWDELCLHFHETGRVVHTRSYDQVRQPLYRRSVGRWRHYQRFLEPLMRRFAGEG